MKRVKYQRIGSEGVSIDKMPENLKDAIVAIEDHRFYEHNGFDVKGIISSLFLKFKVRKNKSRRQYNYSTINKDCAFIRERTYKRKA